MEGFDKAPRLVAVNLWTEFKPPDDFQLKIKKNRDHAEFVGETLPALPFTELMGMLVPEVEKWD